MIYIYALNDYFVLTTYPQDNYLFSYRINIEYYDLLLMCVKKYFKVEDNKFYIGLDILSEIIVIFYNLLFHSKLTSYEKILMMLRTLENNNIYYDKLLDCFTYNINTYTKFILNNNYKNFCIWIINKNPVNGFCQINNLWKRITLSQLKIILEQGLLSYIYLTYDLKLDKHGLIPITLTYNIRAIIKDIIKICYNPQPQFLQLKPYKYLIRINMEDYRIIDSRTYELEIILSGIIYKNPKNIIYYLQNDDYTLILDFLNILLPNKIQKFLNFCAVLIKNLPMKNIYYDNYSIYNISELIKKLILDLNINKNRYLILSNPNLLVQSYYTNSKKIIS